MAAGARSASYIPTDWDPAIQSLVQSLEESRHFRGSLVLVHGSPGVGKARLINKALAEANVSARRTRHTYLEARDAELPYKAVLSLARWAAKLEEIAPGMDSGSLVLAPFLRALTADAPDARNGRAVAAGRASGPASSEYDRLVADLEFYKRGVEAWGERSRFLHEVGWMILDAAARRHIVWIVEGAQYLDPHSLSVIKYLGACLDENPLLLWLNIDTPEDGTLPAALAPLLNLPRARSVELPRLGRAGVLEVLGWRNPSQVFPDSVVDSVLNESHGLLLNVEQLASDPHVLRFPLAQRSAEGPDAVGLELSKVDGLPATARDLVERLAVVGVGTSVEMAVRLAGRGEPAVREDLETLMREGFFLEVEPGQYCFRLTALPAEIAARVPTPRLRELHQAAAEALEASSAGTNELVFDLAEQWRRAERWEPAAQASLKAARFASDSFAPEGGLLYAQRALDAARQLASPRPALEAEALVEKGRALYDLGRLHEGLEALRAALALIEATPAQWPFRARTLFYLARTMSSLARPQEALEVVREASAALDQIHDVRARMMLYQVVGVAFMMSDQNREAVGPFRSMLSLAQTLGDPREVAYAQKNLSAVLLAVNPRDPEGWEMVDAALAHHTRTGNFAGLAAGYLNRSLTKLELHDSEGALKDLGSSRQAAELAHAPLLVASATLQEATVRLDRGDVGRADELLKMLAPWMPTLEEPWARVSFSLLQGRVAEAQDRSLEADRHYETAACEAEPGGESPTLWECRLRRAVLAKRVGNLESFTQLARTLPSAKELSKLPPALSALVRELSAGPT
ncbi:MAG TPA: ATP-binding protein [Thermoplasmata archaeon]|nr:ATP-binding protein [Thermoplasmata archaeon]